MCDRVAIFGGTLILVLFDYFLSGTDVRGMGFPEAVIVSL